MYPVEDDESHVTFEAELMVKESAGCLIAADAYLRFLPDRVELADRHQDGFAVASRKWHTKKRPLSVALYSEKSSHSLWRSIRVEVANRRDHIILLEKNGTFSVGNGGYSSWTQLPNCKIVVVDYSSGQSAT